MTRLEGQEMTVFVPPQEGDEVKVTYTQVKLSDYFTAFAAMLEDQERVQAIAENDPGAVQLQALIGEMRRYAAEVAGVHLATYRKAVGQ